MVSPKILIKVMNVELTDERQQHISSTLGPVTRLIASANETVCDVVIRKRTAPWHRGVYYVMARLHNEVEDHYAIAHAHNLRSAITEVEVRLRRSIGQQQHSDLEKIIRLQNEANAKYFRRLFA